MSILKPSIIELQKKYKLINVTKLFEMHFNYPQGDLNKKILKEFESIKQIYNNQQFAYEYNKFLKRIYHSQVNIYGTIININTLNKFFDYYNIIIFNPLVKNYAIYIEKCRGFIYKLIKDENNNTEDTLKIIQELKVLTKKKMVYKPEYLSLFENVKDTKLLSLYDELKEDPENFTILLRILNYCEVFLTF